MKLHQNWGASFSRGDTWHVVAYTVDNVALVILEVTSRWKQSKRNRDNDLGTFRSTANVRLRRNMRCI
jgi:hypothetical protein